MKHPAALTVALLSALFSSAAIACIEPIPDHPDVVAAARSIYEAEVLSERNETDLRLKVVAMRKGSPSQTILPKQDCTVPSFQRGASVVVIEFKNGQYIVVPNRKP